MRTYEIVLDGVLTSDLPAPAASFTRRQHRGATVLSVPVPDAAALESVLALLESLGIGITAMTELEEPAGPTPTTP
jgi:hypothetical protein